MPVVPNNWERHGNVLKYDSFFLILRKGEKGEVKGGELYGPQDVSADVSHMPRVLLSIND